MGPAILRFSLAAVLVMVSASAQTPGSGPGDNNAARAGRPAEPATPGIPVRDDVTKKACGSCHQADKEGNLSRISWIRTTPEGWQEAIKRMVRLNGVTLKPEDARHIVQYLSTENGLAPEEAEPVAWFLQKRTLQAETNIPTEELKRACASCHPFAQPSAWRRSGEEWKLLTDMHVGYFPVAEFTAFRNGGRGPAPATPGAPPQRHPVDLAVEHFTKNAPLHTPEWAKWKASMRPARLAGRWILWGDQPGKGRVLGEVTIAEGASPNEFTTKIAYTELQTGRKSQRTGRANLYTGYAWRGRSDSNGTSLEDPKSMREVMSVSRDQSTIEGRWFWGGYEELGINAKLVRANEGPQVLGLDAHSLVSGASKQVKIYGERLAVAGLKPTDISMGNGVTVTKIISATPSLITAELAIAKDAISGPRDVEVNRAVATSAVYIYDKVDYIKVSADSAIARLGGNTHPKGYVQFEAIAYHRGLDGKKDTADDIPLGPVQAKWTIEEFLARFDDDDKDHIGSINVETGFFTPASEGPNPKRKWGTDNFGDVWVVATFNPPGGDPAKPLTARSYLVVTVPLYMRWDQPEVAN